MQIIDFITLDRVLVHNSNTFTVFEFSNSRFRIHFRTFNN